MDFRVLGPFEVETVAGPVDLRGDKRRGLLAYLVVHRGELCRTDEVIEALWNDTPASGALGTVQTYVSQLRKVLDADATILTRAGGYVLNVSAGSIDAERFEQLLDRAIAEHDLPTRLDVLNEALALYRGRPLADFAGALWADEAAHRWNRLHLVAIEHLCDVLLELDRERDAQPVLERAVATHPLHERFWEQLALARYRAGDTARGTGRVPRRPPHARSKPWVLIRAPASRSSSGASSTTTRCCIHACRRLPRRRSRRCLRA